MKNTYFVLLTMVFILQASVGWAQRFDRERFGKNRVQHKELQWFYYSSNNFEVYYYDQGMNNARMAIDFLESEFDRLTQSIGYVAYTKPKIFIYNSPEEILQSNLNLNKDEYTIDGQTFFSRLLGEVAFPGNWEDFKRDLIYVTSKVIIEEMLYGSSIVDAFQSNLVNRFPDWYVDGAAMYLAHGWSREMDDYIRHYFKREGQKVRLYKLKEREAALVGQSIWNFIGERYGKRYISSILNLSRINRNEEASIANTIGMDYKNVMTQWQTFYTSVNKPVFDVFKAVKESAVIAETSDRQYGAITDIKFSPDSKHLAYVINNGGRYRVQVRELATERETTLYTGGSVSKDQPVNTTSPVIAWRDTLNLAIATFRGGVTTLRQRAIDGSSNDKIYLRNITQITHMDYNASGRNIVMSVISAGKSDIYTLNARGQGRRVTNDVFDNLTPMWLNDSTIIFSSNQVDLPDSVLTRTPDANKLPGYFNLWKADVDSVVTFERLTNVNYRNVRPMRLNSDNILYLSDQSGITNLNRMSVASAVSSQVSALNKSIEVFDYSSQLNRVAYAVRDGNKARLVYELIRMRISLHLLHLGCNWRKPNS
ncbi:TolB family protein [Nitritalea halalkaliphila]|uniref:TolB family protein n=1 Tax=Nitritalea halalkaliphila TaxID=590849 RepID=UPI0003036BE9|nr:hypothetical protein [Nitritalea halalkaliphila]